MNVYFGFVSLVICSFCGYRLSVKFTERKKFFIDFFNFNEKMINEVSFSQKTLLTVADGDNKLNNDFFVSLRNKIIGNQINLPTYLTKEDNDFFTEYSENIGKSDKISQISFLTAKRSELEKIKSDCESDEKKYRKIYVKLGVLFGLIILIASL